jgi:pantothenate kinase type III
VTNLVVDIGNSSVKASFVIGTTLEEVIRFEGEDVASFIATITENRKPRVIAISSVSDIIEGTIR